MKFYNKQYNAAIGQFEQVVTEITPVFKSPVATIVGVEVGAVNTVIVALDSKHMYISDGTKWVDQGVIDLTEQIIADTMEFLS